MSIPDQKGTCQSIIDEYGQITMLDVHTAVNKYHRGNCCNAQNCYQLYMCLLQYITREVFLKVNAYVYLYLLGATKEPSEICFLWLLIQSATIYTNDTVNTIWKGLYTLDSYMIKVDYNSNKIQPVWQTQMQSTHIPWGIRIWLNHQLVCGIRMCQQFHLSNLHGWHSRVPMTMTARILLRIDSWKYHSTSTKS